MTILKSKHITNASQAIEIESLKDQGCLADPKHINTIIILTPPLSACVCLSLSLHIERVITLLVNIVLTCLKARCQVRCVEGWALGSPVERCPGGCLPVTVQIKKNVTPMLTSLKAFKQRTVIPTNTRHVVITFPVLASMHDWVGQVRKRQK